MLSSTLSNHALKSAFLGLYHNITPILRALEPTPPDPSDKFCQLFSQPTLKRGLAFLIP
jgi:hypothetical protein